MFTVYVLFSEKTGVTYTGYTSDMDKRLKSHNSLATKGFTLKYRPWVLLYSENYSIKQEAIQREKELKQGKGRKFIKKIIEERSKR